ncbi:MAG TPA: MBL fold metallo-hydrolase [Firmicutes bacterium]|nr:MBL fold metallo-hydrolase [Bacillota bacterium]
MIIKSLVVGMFATNCYLLGCPETREAAVIDPGSEGKKILNKINSLELKVKYIINTHAHVDHIAANSRLKEAAGGLICLHEKDLPLYRNPSLGMSVVVGKQPEPDRLVAEGEKISFGSIELEVLETPGHTKGGISLLAPGLVFTGDSLFAGSIGRTDFPGGSMEQLLESIHTKLMVLPEQTKVFPGHGPDSEIGREKRSNPFLR